MANLDAIYRVIHQPSGTVVDDYESEASALACVERENEEYPDSHVVVKYVRADQAPPAAVPVHVSTLRWWRELAQINPADLVPRIDAMLAAARKGE